MNKQYDMSDMDKLISKIDHIISESVDKVADHIINKAKRSFKTKSFEQKAWETTLFKSDSKGTLANSLRKNKIGVSTVQITSDLPYGNIQNYGGKIRITDKMRKFFWAKFYDTKNNKWKGLALTKKTHIVIPERTFLADTPQLQLEINAIIVNEFKKINK